MRKRERDNVVGKIADASDEKHGDPICVRAYKTDDKQLDEIVRGTGETKASLVRRMIRFALSDKRTSFSPNPSQKKLDWLIKNGRKTDDVLSQMDDRLDDILERVEAMETEVKNLSENTAPTHLFLREFYCMIASMISSQNLILTRLLEFSSPIPRQREKASLTAAAARANQIGEAVKDLDQFASFHNIPLGDDVLERVYLLTKVVALKNFIATASPATSDRSRE